MFNSGDEFSIRKVLIGLDQNGRGKGDLVNTNNPRFWPNEQQETCFSWNNQDTAGRPLGFQSGIPTQHEGIDKITRISGLDCQPIRSRHR